jgi:hypothetical protein
MVRANRIPAVAGTVAAAAFAAAASGCADDTSYKNTDRPPAPIVITASIDKDKVSVSPTSFGAGPIKLIVVNATDRSQQVTLETADDPGSDKAGVKQSTGPINPQDNATLAADVRQGTYSVHVAGDDIADATLAVGKERPTSQQDLMLP